ncbi:MAG: FAD binding domain-containing protein [Burkholderiales bacterium]
MPIYLRPRYTGDALAALAQQPLEILAGGTDFYPVRVGRMVDEDVLDITGIGALRGITEEPAHYRFGATTTWTDIVQAPLPAWLKGLQWAAREVGGPQIQNAGTIGGNLCNASPAADGVPVLMALNASVELVSASGVRQMPLTDFLTGNRKTRLAPSELLAGVLVPKLKGRARSTFLKLGARRYLVISIAMVGACVETDEKGRITQAGIAVGACSVVAQRLRDLEDAVVGAPVNQAWELAEARHLKGLNPIDDVRGDASYRRRAALQLVRDALRELPHE